MSREIWNWESFIRIRLSNNVSVPPLHVFHDTAQFQIEGFHFTINPDGVFTPIRAECCRNDQRVLQLQSCAGCNFAVEMPLPVICSCCGSLYNMRAGTYIRGPVAPQSSFTITPVQTRASLLKYDGNSWRLGDRDPLPAPISDDICFSCAPPLALAETLSRDLMTFPKAPASPQKMFWIKSDVEVM